MYVSENEWKYNNHQIKEKGAIIVKYVYPFSQLKNKKKKIQRNRTNLNKQ